MDAIAGTVNSSPRTAGNNEVIPILVDPEGRIIVSGNRTSGTATIANGASLSDAVDLASKTLSGIVMSAAWTAAVITFAVSSDGVTYQPMQDDAGNEYQITTAAAKNVSLSALDFLAWRYIKVRSGTSSAAVAQGGERALTLVAV